MSNMPAPVTRYWIKIWENGNATPQFKPDTGEEILWGDKNSGMIGLMFVPFTPEFAQIVREKGTFAIPSRLPIIDIPLNPDESVRVRRNNAVVDGTCYLCHNCQNMFDWPEIPPELACPRCGTKNHWYCDKHGQIDDPIFFDRHESENRTVTEVRCPICSDPHGLIRSSDLEMVERPTEFRTVYRVQVDGVTIEFDENRVKVLRPCPTQNTTSTS